MLFNISSLTVSFIFTLWKKHHKHNLKHLFLCSSEERFSSVLITIHSSANDKTEAKEINQRAHLHTCFAWDRARWEARALDVYCNQAFISLPEESTDVSHSKWHIALRTQMLLLHKIHDSCFLSLECVDWMLSILWWTLGCHWAEDEWRASLECTESSGQRFLLYSFTEEDWGVHEKMTSDAHPHRGTRETQLHQ